MPDISIPGFPSVRMRRMRRDKFSRDLMRENRLSPEDLIQPFFVMEGHDDAEAIPSMPDVERLTIDRLIKKARHLHDMGVPAVVLFPVVTADKKSERAEEAYNPDGLVQRTVVPRSSDALETQQQVPLRGALRPDLIHDLAKPFDIG